MLKEYWFFILIGAATLASCNNGELSSGKNVGEDAVYADYKVWGEEGKEKVTVLLQFRMGGPEGETIVLRNPGGVSIDSIPLAPDSAGISGVYYEAAFPSATFEGDHIIEANRRGEKKHKHAFAYDPFTFFNEPPPSLTMQPITFQIRGLPDSVKLRLLLTDTAFATNDVNTEIVVIKGYLTITEQMWQKLRPGPMVLEIYREEKKPLFMFSKAGGVMTISYGLKREFIAVSPGADTSGKRDRLKQSL